MLLPLLLPVLLLPEVANLLRPKLLPILIVREGELDLLVLLGGKGNGAEGSRRRARRQLQLLVAIQMQVGLLKLVLLLSLLWLHLVVWEMIVLLRFRLLSPTPRLVLLQILHTLLRPTLLPLHQ